MAWRARTRGEAGSGGSPWCSWTALPRVIHLVIVDNDSGGYDHVGDVDNCGDVDGDYQIGEDDDTVKANLQAQAG